MASSTSSESFTINSPLVTNISSMTENLFLKTLTTTVKLNDNNYLLQAPSFRLIVGAQRKIRDLLDHPPNENDHIYSNWFVNDYCVITCLLNSMEE